MRIVISGYYGFGNRGDEAVLRGVLTALRRAGSVDVTVLSGDPGATRTLHGVCAVDRYNPLAVWRAVRSADLVISGGGGLIQDRTSARSSLYYLGVIALAAAAGVPVYLYAQGVGPLRRRWLRRAVGVVLRRVAGAGVRDEPSRELLKECGLPAAHVQVTADAAFALEPADSKETEEALASIGVEPGRQPLIGVVWRWPLAAGSLGSATHVLDSSQRSPGSKSTPEAAYRQGMAQAVAGFAEELGAKVVVIPFHPEQDDGEARAFAQAAREAGADARFVDLGQEPGSSGDRLNERPVPSDPRRLLALVGGMDLVFSVRFHGLVFAALAGKPAVALTYDPKVRHLAEALGVPWFVPEADPSRLRAALDAAWTERDRLSQRVAAQAALYRRRAFDEGVRALAFGRKMNRKADGPARRGTDPQTNLPPDPTANPSANDRGGGRSGGSRHE